MKNVYLILICLLWLACENGQSTKVASPKVDFSNQLQTALEDTFKGKRLKRTIRHNEAAPEIDTVIFDNALFEDNFIGLDFFPDNFTETRLGDTLRWLPKSDIFVEEIKFIRKDEALVYLEIKQNSESIFSKIEQSILYDRRQGVRFRISEDLIGKKPSNYEIAYNQ